MKTRTWPYGTKKEVRIDLAQSAVILGIEVETNEGFAIVGHGLKELPVVGETRSIIFVEGGPTGGYWKFEAKEVMPK